jgi:ribonuclease HI
VTHAPQAPRGGAVPAQKRVHGVLDLEQFQTRLAELRASLDPPVAAGDYVAYTDGACLGNPDGPGGWAAVVDRPAGGEPWLLFGHLSSTSNNRAEALGVLAALEWAPPGSKLLVHSDSELTVRILQNRYKARANPDIWEVLRRTISEKKLGVLPEWVRGHAGDPGNELADRLSRLGAYNAGIETLADVLEEPARAVRAEPPELDGLEPRGDWERDFVRSVAKQLREGRALSDKQQAVIKRIRAREK